MSWLYKRTLSFDATDENNKQVIVTLTTLNFDYSQCDIFGDDLRFGPDPNSSYSYYIKIWNTAGTSTIIVKVPTSGTASMLMWYGNSAAASESDPRSAYDFYSDFETNNLWANRGTLLWPTEAWTQNVVGEGTVLYEGNPQILTQYENVFKLWYSGGWGSPAMGYAEISPDLETVEVYSGNPVQTGLARNFVVHSGDTYYRFAAPSGDLQINLYSSSYGVTGWTLVQEGIIGLGAAGQWDDGHVADCYVWYDANTGLWTMLYEGAHHPATAWKGGLATAPAITGPWTKSGSNPVINPAGTFGTGKGNAVHYSGGQYYVMGFGSISGNVPTDIYRYKGASLTGLSLDPAAWTKSRETVDEGYARSVGQIGGQSYVQIGSTVYMFYAANPDGVNPVNTRSHIKLAVYSGTMDQLVASSENFYTPTSDNWTIAPNTTLSFLTTNSHIGLATLSVPGANAYRPALTAPGISSKSMVVEGYILWPNLVAGLMFRVSSGNTFYGFKLQPDLTTIWLFKNINGTPTDISGQTFGSLALNTLYPFTLRVSGTNSISLTINGVTRTWTDDSVPAGSAGMFVQDFAGYRQTAVDTFSVRKYYAADPVVTVGEEEAVINGLGIFGRGIGCGLVA